MPTLSDNDPPPSGRSGPPVWLIATVLLVVLVAVALHLTGVVGPK
jgi:hypothetical protein